MRLTGPLLCNQICYSCKHRFFIKALLRTLCNKAVSKLAATATARFLHLHVVKYSTSLATVLATVIAIAGTTNAVSA